MYNKQEFNGKEFLKHCQSADTQDTYCRTSVKSSSIDLTSRLQKRMNGIFTSGRSCNYSRRELTVYLPLKGAINYSRRELTVYLPLKGAINDSRRELTVYLPLKGAVLTPEENLLYIYP